MKNKIDFKSQSIEDLLKQEKELRLQLLKTSYNIRSFHEKNTGKKRELKKNIARILTEITARSQKSRV